MRVHRKISGAARHWSERARITWDPCRSRREKETPVAQVELARPRYRRPWATPSRTSTLQSLTMFYSCVCPGFRDDSAFRFGPSLVEPYSMPPCLSTPPLSPSCSSDSLAELEPGVDEPSTLSSFDSSTPSSSSSLDASDGSLFSEARASSPLSTPLFLKPELVSTARRIHRLLVGLPRSFSAARRRTVKSLGSAQTVKETGPRKSRGVNVLLLRYLHLVAREPSLPATPNKASESDFASPYVVNGVFLELLPSVLLSILFTAQRATDLEHMCTSLYLRIVREKHRVRDPPTALVHLTSLPLPAVLLTFCLRSSCRLARWFTLQAIDLQVAGVHLSITEEGGLLSVALAVSVPVPLWPGKLELLTVFVGVFENGCGEEAFFRRQVIHPMDSDARTASQEVQVSISNDFQDLPSEGTMQAITGRCEAHAGLQRGGEGKEDSQRRSMSPVVSEESHRRRRLPCGDAPTISTDARKLVNEAGIMKSEERRPNKLRKPRRRPVSRAVSPRPSSPRPLSPRPLSPRLMSARPLSPRPSSSRPLSPRPTSPRPVSPVAPQLATYKVIRLNIQFAPLRMPTDDALPAPASSQPAHTGPQRRGMPNAEQRAERKVVMAGFKAAGRKWKGKLKGKGRGMGMSRFARMSAETRVREAAARSRPTSPVAGPSRPSAYSGGISQRLGEPTPNENGSAPAKKQKMKWGKCMRKSSSQG